MKGVELRWLSLHLRSPHVTSLGQTSDRPVVIARVATDAEDGWGECAALAVPDYSEEYAEGAWSVLVGYLVPLLVGSANALGGLPDAGHMTDVLRAVRGHRMAKACLEMAVLDAGLRSAGQSLRDRLGAVRDSVPAGAVVGLAAGHDPEATAELTTAKLIREVDRLRAQGFTRVKVKIAPGDESSPLAALRRAFPDLGLQADANGSFRLDDPGHVKALLALDDLGLICLEQPLDPEDLAGHARLARDLETPVCLDESVSSLGRLADAIALGACDMVCVKPARLGGLLQAVAAHDICTGAQIGLFCGGMLETALARSANAAVASLPGFLVPGDVTSGERFSETDPFLAGAGPDIAPDAGPNVTVHRGPGVGPAPDMAALDLVTTRRHWAPAG
jgi:O-succinylbenzoate synthase